MLDEKVDRLQTILEIDDSALASTLLDDSGWDIELAVENYFNSQASSTENTENSNTSATPSRLPISPSIAHVGLGSGRSAQPGSFIWTIWRGILWLAIKILRLPLWLYSFLFNQSVSFTPPEPVPQEEAHSLLLSSIDEAVNSREPSSSSTAVARTTQRQNTHVIPSLYLGTHSNALRDVKNNAQFGIIAFIDSSTTSDDFKYHTLAEEKFNKLVNEHDCLVWVGDISTNRDAYDVAISKGIRIFPRVEVHSMQALPTSRNALVSVPTMSHLGSISGKDSLGEDFRNLLSSRYLNRVSPYLRRLRNEKYERQRATYIKEAADRAENERMQRDAENVLKKREESARSAKAAEDIAQQREKERNEKANNEVILREYRNWLKSTIPGDSGYGWKPVAEFLSQSLPHVKFILPHAPSQPVTLNGGMSMPSWFDLTSLTLEGTDDEDGLLKSSSELNKLITAEVDNGIPSDRIVIGGFSQGSALSYLIGLSSERKLAGTVALSGWLPMRNKIKSMLGPHHQLLPIFQAHGSDDPVVNPKYAELTNEYIKSLGFKTVDSDKPTKGGISFNKYDGIGHGACQEELADLEIWLKKVIP
ncbi:hypothetical protein E3Q11_01956 [Wallemia mellicola]|nr:hypothetical protein E3Q11_01956 [Wallemia mellicola]